MKVRKKKFIGNKQYQVYIIQFIRRRTYYIRIIIIHINYIGRILIIKFYRHILKRFILFAVDNFITFWNILNSKLYVFLYCTVRIVYNVHYVSRITVQVEYADSFIFLEIFHKSFCFFLSKTCGLKNFIMRFFENNF